MVLIFCFFFYQAVDLLLSELAGIERDNLQFFIDKNPFSQLFFASSAESIVHLLLPFLSGNDVVFARFFLERGDHDVVVSYFYFFMATVWEHIELIDALEVVEPLVDQLGCYDRNVGLVQQQPVRVFSLKNRKIFVKKGLDSLELLIIGDLAFYEVGRIYKMV